MFKKLVRILLITTLFLGGNVMAEETLNTKQKAVSTVAAYAALGN